MALDRIKTYEQLDNILFDIDYNTLSDEDIERLCAKVWEIYEGKKAQIEATETNPDLGMLSVTSAKMEAVARCEKLRNCTPKRVLANIRREQETWDQQGTRNPSDYALMSERERAMEMTLH